MFLGSQMKCNNEEEQEFIGHDANEKEEQQVFHDTLEILGAKDLYDDEETIMGLWMKLRETDPTLLRQFEQFIGRVTEEIKRSKSDHRSIEAALQSKSTVYNDEIKKLYEEMEQQIKIEKTKVLEEVSPFIDLHKTGDRFLLCPIRKNSKNANCVSKWKKNCARKSNS
jgi:hypothetical protein